MGTRYGRHDTVGIHANQDSAPLDLVPLKHPMPEEDNESSDEYPLDEHLEQFKQLKDQFANLKSTTPQFTPTAELTQLTDKLQHLTMMLQPHSALPV